MTLRPEVLPLNPAWGYAFRPHYEFVLFPVSVCARHVDPLFLYPRQQFSNLPQFRNSTKYPTIMCTDESISAFRWRWKWPSADTTRFTESCNRLSYRRGTARRLMSHGKSYSVNYRLCIWPTAYDDYATLTGLNRCSLKICFPKGTPPDDDGDKSALSMTYSLGKGKEYHTPWRVLVGCSSPLVRPWVGRWINHLNLWRIWPVQRQTYGYLPSRRTSLPRYWYQIMLFGDRSTCVWTTCPRSLPWQRNGR